MADAPTTPDFDSIDYRRSADPRKYFAERRAEVGTFDTEEGYEGRIMVLTYDAGMEILRHPEIWSSGMGASPLGNARPLIPLQVDPPDHVRYRRLLDPVFSPRNIDSLQPEVLSRTNELIDRFESKGECDFSEELAVPLPTAIFLGLLGLPMEGLEEFLTLKDGIIRTPGATDEERAANRAKSGERIYAIYSEVLEQRRKHPQDDLLTWMIDVEVEGEKLEHEEILDICFLLMLAGLDTVAITLECMFHHLATHPEHRQAISADPDVTPNVVEELLRWETPVMGTTRIALEDTEVAGCPFKADSRLQVSVASINTDPHTEAGWDTIDFHRENNRHLAFGGGIHRCLGSHLARMELRTALREWHRRIPEYQIKPGVEVIWNGAQLRGIDHLQLSWGS
jgi:cytochrome P450